MTAHDSFADDHTYEKTLRWWDGFTISLSIPAALFVGMGYAIGLIGAWTTLVLLGLVAVLACLQNYVYSEMASMFVDKVGGISMYAHQGWRRRSTLVGPVATYGYWFSWSSSLAIYGLQIGKLVQSEWFPDQTWTLVQLRTGSNHAACRHVVSVSCILAPTRAEQSRRVLSRTHSNGRLSVPTPPEVTDFVPTLLSLWTASNRL